MPRGFGAVRQASAELEARRTSGPGAGALWFRLKSGEEAIVRFLEQDDDVACCQCHEVPVEGRQWGRDVPCLDQERDGTPCPGCERDLPRRFKGWVNLIWFDAPVFKRDSENKIVKDRLNDPVVIGNKPQVALWSSGIRLFEELEEINANYKGLTTWRFKVKRKGQGLDTKYIIVPEDVTSGATPFDDAEKKLAEDKYDLNEFIKPPSYEDFLKALGQGGQSAGNGQQASPEARPNPFMRNKPGT